MDSNRYQFHIHKFRCIRHKHLQALKNLGLCRCIPTPVSSSDGLLLINVGPIHTTFSREFKVVVSDIPAYGFPAESKKHR